MGGLQTVPFYCTSSFVVSFAVQMLLNLIWYHLFLCFGFLSKNLSPGSVPQSVCPTVSSRTFLVAGLRSSIHLELICWKSTLSSSCVLEWVSRARLVCEHVTLYVGNGKLSVVWMWGVWSEGSSASILPPPQNQCCQHRLPRGEPFCAVWSEHLWPSLHVGLSGCRDDPPASCRSRVVLVAMALSHSLKLGVGTLPAWSLVQGCRVYSGSSLTPYGFWNCLF